MKNKLVAIPVGIDVVREIKKQSDCLTNLMPLIKNLEPITNLAKQLEKLKPLYDGLPNDLDALRNTQNVFTGMKEIETLNEKMQDRFWNFYAEEKLVDLIPIFIEFSRMRRTEIIHFIASLPDIKSEKTAKLKNDIALLMSFIGLLVSGLPLVCGNSISSLQNNVPEQSQKAPQLQKTVATLSGLQTKPNTSIDYSSVFDEIQSLSSQSIEDLTIEKPKKDSRQ